MQEVWEALELNDINNGIILINKLIIDNSNQIDSWIIDAFNQCPLKLKKRFSLLLCDALAGYPYSLYAAPVQIIGLPNPEAEDDVFLDKGIHLPAPPADEMDARACEELLFLGWAPLTASYSPANALGAVYLPYEQPACVLALFRTELELGAPLNVEIPAPWWESLFDTERTCIVLSAQYVLPYPRALEVGRLLQHSVELTEHKEPIYFATEAECEWARTSGRYFWERCVRQFPRELSRKLLESYSPETDI